MIASRLDWCDLRYGSLCIGLGARARNSLKRKKRSETGNFARSDGRWRGGVETFDGVLVSETHAKAQRRRDEEFAKSQDVRKPGSMLRMFAGTCVFSGIKSWCNDVWAREAENTRPLREDRYTMVTWGLVASR